MSTAIVRPATTADVRVIRQLIDTFADDRRLLSKATVTLYEDVQEFVVAEVDGVPVAVGALHVMWEDLAEVRTLAVDPRFHNQGLGSQILDRLVQRGRDLGVGRIFCLTFEKDFFAAHGFEHLEGPAITADIYAELLQSEDEGVAEFLELERVKPNTLGNERLLLRL